jgi:23S rRNA (guanosine2251-2'-O)-methyltransferase
MISLCRGFGRSYHIVRGRIQPVQLLSSPVMWCSSSRLFSGSDSSDDRDNIRQSTLQEQLALIGVDTKVLHDSAIQSVQDPSRGYDVLFGKSAIKTYRAFLIGTVGEENELQLQAAASRCARQVDFLIKRHKSREAEWVRHIDTKESRTVYPLILLLDNVRSAFNVGSLFRTADAAACSMVITTGITPHPGGSGADKLSKSALGAERVIPHKHFTTVQEAMDYLRDQKSDHIIIGMETTDMSKKYTSLAYPVEGCVLILGNEVTGVDTEIMPLLDEIVEIPMFGAKNSLNIAACAPVVLYEILRQWGAMD